MNKIESSAQKIRNKTTPRRKVKYASSCDSDNQIQMAFNRKSGISHAIDARNWAQRWNRKSSVVRHSLARSLLEDGDSGVCVQIDWIYYLDNVDLLGSRRAVRTTTGRRDCYAICIDVHGAGSRATGAHPNADAATSALGKWHSVMCTKTSLYKDNCFVEIANHKSQSQSQRRARFLCFPAARWVNRHA